MPKMTESGLSVSARGKWTELIMTSKAYAYDIIQNGIAQLAER